MSGAELVLAVLPLGIIASQGIVTYYDKYKAFPSDLDRLRRQHSSLTKTFGLFESAVNGSTGNGVAGSAATQVADCAKECKDAVDELEFIRKKFEKPPPTNALQKLQEKSLHASYPLRKGPLISAQELVENLIRQLSLVATALGLDVSISIQQTVDRVEGIALNTGAGVNRLQTGLHRTEAGVDRIETGLSRTEAGVTKLLTGQEQKRFDDIIHWLGAPDPNVNHQAARQLHEEGTGKWFLDCLQFNHWAGPANNASQCTRMLWVHGKPGCCKTVLSSTIIEELRTSYSNTGPVLYFYFTFSDSEKQSYGALLRSLLTQLAQHLESFEELEPAYMAGKKDDSTLGDILHKMLRRAGTSYVIVDALDECPESNDRRSQLLQGLSTLSKTSLPLKILVTSRKESDIERAISAAPDAISMPVDNKANNVDISLYVESQLRRDPRLAGLPATTLKEIRGSLTSKADGMFRWVYCQLDELRRLKMLRPQHVSRALTSLPKTLHETYERMVVNIDPMVFEEACTALRCIAFARRPMSLDEIVEACITETEPAPRVDIDSRQAVRQSLLDVLGSLVVVLPFDPIFDKRPCVQFAHFSVEEFLVNSSTRQTEAAKFYLDEFHGHARIAQTCAAYLIVCRRSKMEADSSSVSSDESARIENTGLSTDEVCNASVEAEDDTASNDVISEFEKYAREEWFYHQRIAESMSQSISAGDLHLFIFHDQNLREYFANCDETSNEFSGAQVWKVGPNYSWPTPIYMSCMLGLPATSARLCQAAGHDVNKWCGTCGSALAVASAGGYLSVVNVLLEYGADVNIRPRNVTGFADEERVSGQSALELACVHGHDQVAEMLLSHGAVANLPDHLIGSVWVESALDAAYIRGHRRTLMRTLLEHGADTDQVGQHGPLLCVAADRDDVLTLQLLVQHGADLNRRNKHGHSAIWVACDRGHTASIIWLLEHGADPNVDELRLQESPLTVACGRALGIAIIEALIRRGANVNTPYTRISRNPKRNRYGPPLHSASIDGNCATLDLLVQGGTDMEMRDAAGNTALQAACFFGQLGSVKFLLEHGADVDADGGRHGTALGAAASGGKTFHDIEGKQSFSGNRFPGDCCGKQRAMDILEYLLSAGASVNQSDQNGHTPLAVALSCGHNEAFKMLLEHGADLALLQGPVHVGFTIEREILSDLISKRLPNLTVVAGPGNSIASIEMTDADGQALYGESGWLSLYDQRWPGTCWAFDENDAVFLNGFALAVRKHEARRLKLLNNDSDDDLVGLTDFEKESFQ